MSCDINTTCPYCGVGCGVTAKVVDDTVIAVSGDSSHPANAGKLCVKGSALHETLGNHGRLLQPQVNGEQVTWDAALDTVANGFSDIIAEHGPGAVAFYLSGQLLTEDYYLANKLAKGFIKTPHVDTNSRLCMSSAVAGYKQTIGADAVPCDYTDLETCDLLILVGSNAAWTHPILYQRMVAAKKQRPNMQIVVVDPRRTATADIADLFLPITPGSDTWLFNGLLNFLAANNALADEYIASHVNGMADALAAADVCTITAVAKACGLSEQTLLDFYQRFAATEKTVTFYSQGVNQSAVGTQQNAAIINCHLATGRIGKAGMGPFSITGQPNAMGGREVGGLATTLAAHMDYTPEGKATVAEFWQVDEVCDGPGYKAVDLFSAVERGEIKAVWIMATNPVVSMPDADRVKNALASCELVVVSDCYDNTDTGALANVLLPATGWSEKDGTVTNSERRISRQRQLVSPAGEAKHDWWIMTQVAQRMGYGEAFAYESPQQVFVEHAALSGFSNNGKRAFDISALQHLTAQEYEEFSPVQWPLPTGQAEPTKLFADNIFFTPTGKANAVAITAMPAASAPQKDTYVLNTGRLRDQWHTMTRTGRASRLLEHQDTPAIYLHPEAALAEGVRANDLLQLTGPAGSVKGIAVYDEGLQTNQLFMPIHWTDAFAEQARVGALIPPVVDATSGQPAFKQTTVSLQRLAHSFTASWMTTDDVKPSNCLHWVRMPLNETTWLYRLYFINSQQVTAFVEQALASACSDEAELALCSYRNGTNGDERYIQYANGRIHAALYIAASTNTVPSKAWYQYLLSVELEGSPWQLLAGKSSEQQDLGRVICSCFTVHQDTIVDAINKGCGSAAALGKKLRCGTNCGSCIPELNTLVAQAQSAAAMLTEQTG